MTTNKTEFPKDPTAPDRRKHLSDEEIKDLELAGGVEGGMQAGSAGGPGGSDPRKNSDNSGGGRPSEGQRKD